MSIVFKIISGPRRKRRARNEFWPADVFLLRIFSIWIRKHLERETIATDFSARADNYVNIGRVAAEGEKNEEGKYNAGSQVLKHSGRGGGGEKQGKFDKLLGKLLG